MSNPASKAFSALIRNLKVALGRAKTAKKTVEKAEKKSAAKGPPPTLAARRRQSEAAKKAKNATLAAYKGQVDNHALQVEKIADKIQEAGTNVMQRINESAERAERTARAKLLEREAKRNEGKGPDRNGRNVRRR